MALGLLLLAIGALTATGRLHGRRKTPVPASGLVRLSRPASPAAGSICGRFGVRKVTEDVADLRGPRL